MLQRVVVGLEGKPKQSRAQRREQATASLWGALFEARSQWEAVKVAGGVGNSKYRTLNDGGGEEGEESNGGWGSVDFRGGRGEVWQWRGSAIKARSALGRSGIHVSSHGLHTTQLTGFLAGEVCTNEPLGEASSEVWLHCCLPRVVPRSEGSFPVCQI